MKRFFFLLTFIVLTFFSLTLNVEASPYKHTAYDLGIARRHNIEECRINEILGDEVFFWTVKEGDSFVFKKVEFYLIDLNSGKETKIPYTLTGIFVSDAYYSGNYLYVLYHDKEDRQCIRQVDLKGNVREDFLLQNTDAGQSYYNIYIEDDTRIIATGNVGVAEFDMTGKRVWQVPFSPVVNHAQYGGGDKFYSTRGVNLYLMDLNTKKLTGSTIISDYSSADLYVNDGKLYIFDESGILLWNADNGNASRIVNFAEYGIESSNYAVSVDGDTAHFIDYDPFDKSTAVTLHTINFNEQGEARKQLMIAIPDYIPFPGEVYDIVEDFKRSNAEYDVQFCNYVYTNEFDSLMDSYSPDVVLMSDADLMRHESRLLNLMPYMSESETLNPSKLIASAKKNYTTDDSCLMVPIELYIESFAVRKSDYGKKIFNEDDFLDYISDSGILYTDYYLSKESILEAIMETGIYEYVNFERGTCSFGSQAFKDLLVKIDNLSADYYFYPDVEYAKPGDGDRVLDDSNIGCFDFFGKKRAVYGEDVTAVGIPADNSTYIMSAVCLAVMNDSECSDGAFKFLEYFFSRFSGSDCDGMILANSEFFGQTVEA
ncbi:MAG: hypothetical protein IKZ39_02925, partial [Lachnospiraceae bacterium]|nr:hypothetical protein [Lachnospiraceae bacterium]